MLDPAALSATLERSVITNMSEVRRLVLDVLKPHQPTMLVLADKLGDLEGIHGVDITLIEIDNKVENIKITLEGDDVDFQNVAEVVRTPGGAASTPSTRSRPASASSMRSRPRRTPARAGFADRAGRTNGGSAIERPCPQGAGVAD